MNRYSTCSFSYHRAVLSGRQDFHGYLAASQQAGMTHAHFWIPHLLPDPDLSAMREWEWRPGTPDIPDFLQPPIDYEWMETMKESIRASGLAVEMIAMEKAFMYVVNPEDQARHHAFLRGWLEVARVIGAPAMRVDPGGPLKGYTMEDRAVAIEGYRLWSKIAREEYGVCLFVENHWGMSQDPEFLFRLLEAVPEVGLLLDSWNWPGERETRWKEFAGVASAVHVKSRHLNEKNEETTYDLKRFIQLLTAADYAGIWGIESFPDSAEEEEAAVVKTRWFIDRLLERNGAGD